MRKYSKEVSQLAYSALRLYLSQGFTYHQAAKRVSEESPVSIITLRYNAYQWGSLVVLNYINTKYDNIIVLP